MKTLTKFIDRLDLNDEVTATLHEVSFGESSSSTRYEVIENEVLKSSDLKDLSISGSLFSLTLFKDVTFESCVFFGSKFENCEFVNCKFIDCSFQFTHISHCNFRASSFKNCIWETSTIRKSMLSLCDMDVKTAFFLTKEENKMDSCMKNDFPTWLDEGPLTLWEAALKDEFSTREEEDQLAA